MFGCVSPSAPLFRREGSNFTPEKKLSNSNYPLAPGQLQQFLLQLSLANRINSLDWPLSWSNASWPHRPFKWASERTALLTALVVPADGLLLGNLYYWVTPTNQPLVLRTITFGRKARVRPSGVAYQEKCHMNFTIESCEILTGDAYILATRDLLPPPAPQPPSVQY